jgi:hypothetical protein
LCPVGGRTDQGFSFSFFDILISKNSQIYTRKTKFSEIFPISLSENGEVLPEEKHWCQLCFLGLAVWCHCLGQQHRSLLKPLAFQ